MTISSLGPVDEITKRALEALKGREKAGSEYWETPRSSRPRCPHGRSGRSVVQE